MYLAANLKSIACYLIENLCVELKVSFDYSLFGKLRERARGYKHN